MRVIQSTSWRRIESNHYYPLVRYVISDQEANWLVESENRKRRSGVVETFADLRMTTWQNYERRYGGQDANGKKILLYRHAAVGDSLIATSIPRYIKALHPGATIMVYCHHSALDYWRSNLFIDRGMAIPIPIHFEAAQQFDYHIMYEGMAESNCEPDQGSGYDALFRFCGLNPPAHFKRPFVFLRPDDYEMVPMFKNDYGLSLEDNYILYHLNPANHNRSYPFNSSIDFWKLFLENYPGWKIVVVGLDEYHDPYTGRVFHNIRAPVFQNFPADRVINLLSKTPKFRHLIPLVENANVVICPDSSISHLSACFPHVPVVSLWGLIPPDLWATDYPNHYPLWHKEVCKVCPCHSHEFIIPKEDCEANADVSQVREMSQGTDVPEGALEWCAVLAAIKPEEIMQTVDALLKGHFSDRHQIFMVKEKGPPKVAGSKDDE